MPAGIPGAVNRAFQSTIEQQLIDGTNPPTGYGLPVAIDATSKKARGVTTGDAATAIYGLNVRPYPTQGNGTDGLGTATPPTSGIMDVLKRGYISVHLGGATAAAKNGTVYVRVAAAAGGKPIGGIEAASDTTNTIVMANSYFMGPADADGNVEIAFNI
jgi:hypothetical protein